MNCCDDYGKCTQGDNCPARETVAKNARPWVGLTDEESLWCFEHSCGNTDWTKHKARVRAIEAKLKEKNT